MTFPPSKHISPFSTFCTLTCSMRNRPVRRLYAICCRTCVTRWVKVICATVICTPSKNTYIQHPKPLVEGLPYSVLVPPSNLGDIIFFALHNRVCLPPLVKQHALFAFSHGEL